MQEDNYLNYNNAKLKTLVNWIRFPSECRVLLPFRAPFPKCSDCTSEVFKPHFDSLIAI